MGESEAGRKGVEGLTRRLVEHSRETGKPMSEDQARKQASSIARQEDAKRGLR